MKAATALAENGYWNYQWELDSVRVGECGEAEVNISFGFANRIEKESLKDKQ